MKLHPHHLIAGILFTAVAFPPGSRAQTTPADTTPPPPSLNIKKIFTLPPAADCGSSAYSPLWSGGGKMFVIWRDSTMHPMVTEITEDGKAESVPLDPNPKYMAQYREMHHSYSLGIDKTGIIHITGDMNGYPGEKDKFQPARYKNKIIMYWRSKTPYSIQGGFEFVGADPARAIPGSKWSSGAFFADNSGELYYMSRVVAVGGAHVPPEMGIGLYRYDTTTGAWTALGGKPTPGYPDATCQTVLFWGLPASSEINREAHGSICFDKQNRMHFATPAASAANVPGMDSLLYACSEDGGKTWKRANGSPIPSLPLRAVPGASQADVVASSHQNGILIETFHSTDLEVPPASVAIQPQFASPGKIGAAVRWSGEIAFPETGTYTVEFHCKDPVAVMSIINKRKGEQEPEAGKLRDGNAQQLEVEKGMTLGYNIVIKPNAKSPAGAFPSLRWQKETAPMADIPTQNLLPGWSRFEPFAEVSADEKGTPAVGCNPSNLFVGKWYAWDPANKKWSSALPYPGNCQQENRILLGADGFVTFESVVGVESYYLTPKVEFFRMASFDQEPTAYLLPGITRICGTDAFTLRTSGLYRTILFDHKSQQWSVCQIEVPKK